MAEILIRPETSEDVDDIRTINIEAFRDHPISQQTEHLIVDALREGDALEVSLVAIAHGRTVGHVAFSRAAIGEDDGEWLLLGPIAVLPRFQNQGVGSTLVQSGLELLRRMGASGCVLVGDPGFYGRFGFRSLPGLTYDGVPNEYVLALPFAKKAPQGRIHADPAFEVEPD